jgi:hypothetical protein
MPSSASAYPIAEWRVSPDARVVGEAARKDHISLLSILDRAKPGSTERARSL